ncbi:MAG TPA: N-acetyltransferase [Cyanobacteria bacterium UBA11369]|nr:N-acetyltransferase [Cyanobacteria bacterium UBA11371]HBE48078.1 N-acetyltransferase [Cyanobacteria bacterium UBA11369]
MTDLTIKVEENPTQEDIRTFIRNLVDYNASQVGEDISYQLAIFIRDSDGKIVGGLVGETYWEWMFVSQLWVSEALRGQGYGRELMLKAEAEAKKRGCHHCYLDTFSFQALGFYQKLGYQIFGTLQDFPPGHQRYFLQKRNL